ncbi:MAG TPA: PQQ-dependent sugar dehydrogenase [Allosphingosinicella sp.]
MFSTAIPAPCAPQSRSARRLSALLALGFLAGCGGGDAPAPPAPKVNQAPTVTSGSSVSVVENVAGSIYQATGSDPEGSPLSFSISGGADAARFSITSGGQLSFVTPPNFDRPADIDDNNIYQVEIAASDGQDRGTLFLTVTVSNSKEGVSTRRVGTSFVNPAAASPVNDTIVLVAEKNGAIYSFNPQNGGKQLLFQIPSVSGHGVLAVLARPDFAATGRFFVMYTNNGFLVVNEYLRNPAGPTVPNNFGPLLQVEAPQYSGGGWLGFAPDGNLLIATGDAGGYGDPSGSAQNDSSRLGKLIRGSPNPDPFAGATANFYVLNTVAKGLHRPVGGFVYPGGLLIEDRGQSIADEVNLFSIGTNGANFGWPFKEGMQLIQGNPPANLLDPVISYGRPGGVPVLGTVGGAVAGNGVASIGGHYVFADRSGAIFSLPTATLQNGITLTLSAVERRTADFAPDSGLIDEPVAVVADSAGRVYLLDADGEIFRVDAG